jgi:hypothetical protein
MISNSVRRLARLAVPAATALGLVFLSRRADAFINAGAEVGLFKRSASPPSNLQLGLGYGFHGEIGLLPFITVGPYYLHYQLSADDRPLVLAADANFNVLGLRARLTLPLPIGFKPYAYVGAGYTWVDYALPLGDRGGHFVEIPIGIGLAYSIVPLIQGSLEFAYRPGSAFGGEAFDLGVSKPDSGFSVLLGIALDL